MRRALGARYDTAAAVVARVLSEQPGLRGGLRASDPDLLADLVALRVHLSDDEAARLALATALHRGRPGPHTPFARGVAAGLTRMPAHRGPVGLVVDRAHRHGADPRAVLDAYAEHDAVDEHGLVLAGPAGAAVPGEDEVAVLAVTTSTRRTRALDPHRPDRFGALPGTRYRVVALDRAARTVWLREAFVREAAEVAARLDEQARVTLEAVVPVAGAEPVRGSAPGLALEAGGAA